MNQFEKELLIMSGSNYEKTGKSDYQYLLRNSNDLIFYTDAASSLVDSGFIMPKSDNIYFTEFNIPEDCLLEFTLTSKGYFYYRDNLKKSEN